VVQEEVTSGKKLLGKLKQYCQKFQYRYGCKIQNLEVGSVPILLIQEKSIA